MSARRMTLVLGAAAGAFLAGGLISLATTPVANAFCVEDVLGMQVCDFISQTTTVPGLFSDTAAGDPAFNYDAMVLQIPSLGITDVLTSGIDPTDQLATVVPGLPDDTGVGMVDVTVNTFQDSMDPALDSSFIIPFTDPLAVLWDAFVPLGF
jgi:hypothetical protein